MDLGSRMSTAEFTHTEALRDMNAHRMSAREWVARICPKGPRLRSLALRGNAGSRIAGRARRR